MYCLHSLQNMKLCMYVVDLGVEKFPKPNIWLSEYVKEILKNQSCPLQIENC